MLNSKIITMRIGLGLLEKLDAVVERLGVSRSMFIKDAIKAHIREVEGCSAVGSAEKSSDQESPSTESLSGSGGGRRAKRESGR